MNPIAIDTETTGLEETDRPFCATISGKDFNIYTEDRDMVSKLLDTSDLVFAQNAKFDARMLSHWDVNMFTKPVYDTNIMARIIRNDYLKYSLADQAKRIGLAKSTEVDAEVKKHKLYETRRNFFGEEYKTPRYDRVDREILKRYALLDSELTYKLGMNYLERMDTKDKQVMLMESNLTPVCYGMERRGLQLNVDYTIKAYHHEKQLLESKLDIINSMLGCEFTDSAKAIQKHLSYQLPLTDANNPSLTDDVIDYIISAGGATPRDSTILGLVREIRWFKKRINTYYESYLNRKDASGIIHPTMWQAGTRTGRFSYSDPNLQNMPKEEDSEEPFVVRGCFKPRDGYSFISLDYSQMEYRMLADYANEKDVIRRVMEGADFHQVTADMFGVSRKQAKTINFACLYGAGVDKLSTMLGTTKHEASRLRDRYFMALPNVERLIDDVISTGKSRGFVQNWYGRKMYAQKEFCYALPNHLIQGGGADVVKLAMIEIEKELRGSDIHMVLQVHDQLVFEYPTGMDNTKLKRVKEIMENTYVPRNGMKLTVDISESTTSLAERSMVKINI
jgi:DNA polymerase-1